MYLKNELQTNFAVDKSTGWKALTVIQICSVIETYRQKQISYKAFRAYFFAAELIAKAEAAARCKRGRSAAASRRRGGHLREVPLMYRRALRELSRAGLLSFENELRLTEAAPIDQALTVRAAGRGRSTQRLVPIPREVLRYLAACPRPATALTMLGYCLRGLSIRGRRINTRGSIKASWIADAFGLSLRAVHAARSQLIELQWISRDVNSTQRKLNRTGAYFEINLAWHSRTQLVEKPVENVLEISVPAFKKRTEFSGPIEIRDNSSNTSKAGAGVSIWNVRRENLFHLGAVGELYTQAVRRGFLKNSEANALNFVGCAVRARDLPNSARVFMGLIKRRLWNYVTQTQEDRARTALLSRRMIEPEFMRG